MERLYTASYSWTVLMDQTVQASSIRDKLATTSLACVFCSVCV
jgi:hypothetical protein